MKDMPIQFTALTEEERDILEEDRRFAQAVLEEKFPAFALDGSPNDLSALQQIFGSGPHTETPEQELVALGTVLGDLIAAKMGMEWIHVADLYGECVALRVPQTLIVSYPREMIIKRVEEEREVDFQDLFSRNCDVIRDLIASGEYKE